METRISEQVPMGVRRAPHFVFSCFRDSVLLRLPVTVTVLIAGFVLAGCASDKPRVEFPPEPNYPADHRYTLDELIDLAIHRNASLDVARYEAEAAEGLVDQVKALWLPVLRYDFSTLAY